MLWALLALISAIASASQNIFHRKIMMSENPYAYAFLENLLTGLVFVPVAILTWSIPDKGMPWLLVLASAIIWTAIAIIAMHSYKFTKVSLRAPVSETRTLWVLALGVLLLAEQITPAKISGILIIFAGIAYLNYRPGTRFGTFTDPGVQLTLLSAFLSALVAIIDKMATVYFSPGTYGMFVYLLPALFLSPYIYSKKLPDVSHILKTKLSFVIAVILAGFVFYYFQLLAFAQAEVSSVYPILRLSTVFTVLGGIVFLNERDGVLRKIVATIVIFLGVLLISL